MVAKPHPHTPARKQTKLGAKAAKSPEKIVKESISIMPLMRPNLGRIVDMMGV